MKTNKEDCISIREASIWLAKMAGRDGVVSSNERQLLKEFAEKYDLDPKALYRMAHAAANDVEIPEVELISASRWKGLRFEEFIVSLCSEKEYFTLLAWRSDKSTGKVYPMDNLMPDLHLRVNMGADVLEYYIECKYRSALQDGILDLSHQMERYRRLTSDRKSHRLFIALGVGGTPSAPASLYLIPDENITSEGIILLEKCGPFSCLPTPEAFHRHLLTYYFPDER